jgi:hypothetical protein
MEAAVLCSSTPASIPRHIGWYLTPSPGHCTPGEELRYALNKGLVGTQFSPDVSEKRQFLFPPEFKPRTVQPIPTTLFQPFYLVFESRKSFLQTSYPGLKRSHCLPIRSTAPSLYNDRFFPRTTEININSLGHKALFEVTRK